MQARKWDLSKDYYTLSEWCKKRKWDSPFPKEVLPSLGIIVEDDSSDSDQEIVISRRRKSKSIKQKQQLEGYSNDVKVEQKKSEPINIPDIDEEPSMEKPKKQSKSVEPIVKEQKYTREQILRAYGL